MSVRLGAFDVGCAGGAWLTGTPPLTVAPPDLVTVTVPGTDGPLDGGADDGGGADVGTDGAELNSPFTAATVVGGPSADAWPPLPPGAIRNTATRAPISTTPPPASSAI